MWVAREKSGLLRMYTEKPSRKLNCWYLTDESDCITIDPSLFPKLLWENEPIEVVLIPTEEIQKISEKVMEWFEDGFDTGYRVAKDE